MNLLIHLFFAFCIAAVTADSADDLPPKYKKIYETCKKSNHLSNADLKKIENQDIPNSRNAKCAMACCLQKANLLKNGKVDESKVGVMMELIGEHMSSYGLVVEAEETMAQKAVSTCNEQVKSKEKCEYAYDLANCLKAQATAMESWLKRRS